jgi:acetoin utilization protein AcuB
MAKLPLVKSVMTAFPYSVDVSSLLKDAHAYMREHNIHHLPVTKGNNLVGILDEHDIAGNGGSRVSEINLKKPYTFDLNARLDDVLNLMADRHVHTVLITRKQKLVGIFTVTDACRRFAEYIRNEFGPRGGGEAA